MAEIRSIVAETIAGVLILYAIATELLDNIGRLEMIETKWPRLHKAMSNRPVRLALILVVLILIGEDVSERFEIPTLNVTIKSPSVPVVQFVGGQIPKAPIQNPTTSLATPKPTGNLTNPPFNPAPQQIPFTQQLPQSSAYEEVTKATNDLEELNKNWAHASMMAANPPSNVHPPTPEMMSNRSNALLKEDTEFSKRWASMEPEVIKAHSDAISRMSASGVRPLTPNDIARDNKEFADVIKRVGTSLSFDQLKSNTYDNQRFEVLLNYFKNLQNRLGEYSEASMQR